MAENGMKTSQEYREAATEALERNKNAEAEAQAVLAVSQALDNLANALKPQVQAGERARL